MFYCHLRTWVFLWSVKLNTSTVFTLLYMNILYWIYYICIWSWTQIPLRPTFYSYFKESVSGRYICICMYIYIYSQEVEGRGSCRWLNRDKENVDTRNPSLYAFSFSHDIHMSIKRETRKGLLLSKNHMCKTYFKLLII